ncbi:hypothetical protein HanPI659440_Chr14g0525501 [Helianthus annuus]|nr:hypothetical protein HanPI659440_Chr14g0525501 [Helianthus annuus]
MITSPQPSTSSRLSSPGLTCRRSDSFKLMNRFLSPVMWLLHPLSKYQQSFFITSSTLNIMNIVSSFSSSASSLWRRTLPDLSFSSLLLQNLVVCPNF